MGAYHQFGDRSWNLISEPELKSFRGVVLSPVNNTPEEVRVGIAALAEQRAGLDFVLDPQMYKPASDRGTLKDWGHVTSDFDTVDLGNLDWWGERCRLLVEEAANVGADSIASPAILPRAFDDDYYDWLVNCGDRLLAALEGKKQQPLLTAIVSMADIGKSGAPERIASMLTRSKISRIYLVLLDDVAPRSQRMDSEGLAGAMRLIRMLEAAGSHVLVACSGLDMLLWKAAGATDVATGKFFNLRRFVPGRWDEPKEKGQVVAYWTDDDLLTWLRENEVRLLLRSEVMSRDRMLANPFGKPILEILDKNAGDAWVALSWRQYMYWFAQREADVAAGRLNVRAKLEEADKGWATLEQRKIFMFDRANNGEWIRAWLNAFALNP